MSMARISRILLHFHWRFTDAYFEIIMFYGSSVGWGDRGYVTGCRHKRPPIGDSLAPRDRVGSGGRIGVAGRVRGFLVRRSTPTLAPLIDSTPQDSQCYYPSPVEYWWHTMALGDRGPLWEKVQRAMSTDHGLLAPSVTTDINTITSSYAVRGDVAKINDPSHLRAYFLIDTNDAGPDIHIPYWIWIKVLTVVQV